MSTTLLTLKTQLLATVGDEAQVDFDPANLVQAINWAFVRAAELTGKTVSIRTLNAGPGTSLLNAAPALEIRSVTVLP